ncbi:phage tail tube protein [Sneathiella sp.]|jgi:hypothetical protein|uniref:phage tail tube protein n=1 Tax=Sneathiella sp. TaxID=1964365 RepID=UPI0039E420B6
MVYSAQSQHGMAYIKESLFGEVPASPTMTALRHTGCSLALNRTSIQSDEIRPDRHMGHFVPGQTSISGDIDFELCYGSHDDLLASAFYGDWVGDTLKTGVSEKSFSIERIFGDVGHYQVFSGCVVDEFSLTVQPDSLVTGRFSIKGKELVISGAPLDVAPVTVSNHTPIDSFKGQVLENGVELAIAAGVDLKIENNVEGVFTLSDETAIGLTAGRSRVSGELTAYFSNDALLDRFIQKTPSSLEIALVGDGGRYEIYLPNILYMGADMPVKGDGAVILTLPFVAQYDDVEGTNIKLTKTAI